MTITFPGEEILEFQFAPEGKIIACVTAHLEGNAAEDAEYHDAVSVWNAKTGKPLWRQARTKENLEYINLRFSPDGETLAANSFGRNADDEKGDVRLWEAKTGGLKRVIYGCGFSGVAFSADGKTLAISGHGKRAFAALYDATTGKRLRSLAYSGEKFITRFAFSPDNRRVAALTIIGTEAGEIPQEVIFWDTQTGKQIWRSADPDLESSGYFLAFANAGRRLIVGERFVDLTRRPTVFNGCCPGKNWDNSSKTTTQKTT